MQVTVSHVSPVQIELRVSLPRTRVSTAVDAAFNEVGKQAQLKGFRKGKVPRPILKQYFGQQVAEKVVRKLVDETLNGALRDQRIEPIATTDIKVDDDLYAGTGDWSYTAHVEVRPEVNTFDTSTLALTRTVYTVTDAEVDAALNARREENATLHTCDPTRPSRAGDTVTADMSLSLDGVERPEFSTKGRNIEVGVTKLLAVLTEALTGISVGESRAVDVTFPADHRQKELAGRTGQMTVSISAVQEKHLPELDDEFAKDLGKDSLAELRASVRGELEAAAKERSEDELRQVAVDLFVKANPVTVPPSMVEQVLGPMRQEFARNFAMKGEKLPKEIDNLLRDDAANRLRGGLLLSEFARVNGLQVTDADIDAQLEEMAKETGKAVQRLRVEYRDRQKREQIFAQVLEVKVLELLLSKATITDKPYEIPVAETSVEAKAE